MLGVGVPWVDELLRRLEWPRDVQEAVDRELLQVGAAKWISRISDEGERSHCLGTALRDGCTEALGRWYFQQWSLKGTVPANDGPPRRAEVTGLPFADPTWPCYLCLEPLSFGSLYTVRMCAKCAPVVAANRDDGKSQDPNVGLLG